MTLQATEIQVHARKLYESLGSKALAEAAQKAASLTRDGRTDEARTWRRIEEALMLIHGPRAS